MNQISYQWFSVFFSRSKVFPAALMKRVAKKAPANENSQNQH